MTEFNSVISLVNSDLLTRTAFKLVRDYKIPNQPQNKKWKFLYDQVALNIIHGAAFVKPVFDLSRCNSVK